MPSVTLVESGKLSQDMLVSGVIENIVTVNPMFRRLPFDGIEGNALAYNRENAMGDSQVLGVGGVITAKAAATFSPVTSSLTTIIGDAEVNGLIQMTRSNKVDQTATQVSSKAKSVGRKYQDMLINGTGTSDQFTGLLGLVDAAKIVEAGAAGANGAPLAFGDLDAIIDLVTAKDGQVDFFAMNGRTLRSYLALLRALGGATVNEVLQLAPDITVYAYRGIPIFRNDWIPINQTKGAATNCAPVICGCFDDGSRTNGVAGIAPVQSTGIQVEDVGIAEAKDERITRVKWYCGLSLFSLNALAVLKNVTN